MSTTHSPNHLKPGQPMQHDDHGVGIVANTYISGLGIHYATYTGHAGLTCDFTAWEPVETCTWLERQWLDYRGGVECICDTNPATTDGPSEECEIHGRRYSEWVERATKAEKEQELTDVVKPGHVQVRVDDLNKNGLRRLGNREEEPNTNTHAQWNAATRVGKAWAATQQPAQPDEPQEFGARVSVTTSDGTVEKWLRIEGGKEYPSAWSKEHFLTVRTWEELTKRGQVSLGWDDAQ